MLVQQKDLSECSGIQKNFNYIVAEEGEAIKDGYWYHLNHWISPNFLKMKTSWNSGWELLIEEEPVVGMAYENRQKFLVMADQPGFRMFLERDPFNPSDSNTVKVMASAVINGKHVHTQLGFLSRETADFLKDKGDLDARPNCVYLPYEGRSFDIRITILAKIPELVDPVPIAAATPEPVTRPAMGAGMANHRWWLLIVGIGSMAVAEYIPLIPLLVGSALLICLLGLTIPPLNTIFSKLLKIETATMVERVLRLALCGTAGCILIVLACSTYYGNWSEQKLKAQNQRIYEADVYYDFLVAEASEAADAGNLSAAMTKIQAALDIPYATDYKEARILHERVLITTQPQYLQAALLNMPDDEYKELKELGLIPSYFFSGHKGLDKEMAKKVREAVPEITPLRGKKRITPR